MGRCLAFESQEVTAVFKAASLPVILWLWQLLLATVAWG